MLEAVSQRFQGSCMMIMRRVGGEVRFLGSGFLVHPEGYLVTAARFVAEREGLVVVPPSGGSSFEPVTRAEVTPVPIDVVAVDEAHDVALILVRPDMEINMPSDILGSSEDDEIGATLASFGVPFGYYRMHTVVALQSVLSARVLSKTETRLLIFDRRVQYGDIGGPLVSATDGAIVGMVGGVFDPLELEGEDAPPEAAEVHSDLSYAMSIEYAAALLRDAVAD